MKKRIQQAIVNFCSWLGDKITMWQYWTEINGEYFWDYWSQRYKFMEWLDFRIYGIGNYFLLKSVELQDKWDLPEPWKKPINFVQDVINGIAIPEQIDNYIEDWHESKSEKSIWTYLGMTADEYITFVEQPQLLQTIIDKYKKES